jgi:hypothetical protein
LGLTSRHVRTLVVTPEQEEIFWVLDFVAQQQEDRLQRLFPPVHIVAQEEVVGGGREPAHLEQTDEIGVLPEANKQRFRPHT